MFKRFQSGHFSEDAPADDKGTSLEKECLIVYPGTFQSMDGEVEVTAEHIQKLAQNHNSLFEKAKRLATGDVPLRECPPLQLDHQTTATHTVGRLVGPLEIKDVNIEGQKQPGLFGRVRVLGAENVEKVKDGRWIHLSMGADLEDGKLTELTITPFPAAARASMLTRNIQMAAAVADKVEEKVTPDLTSEMHEPLKVMKINDDDVQILQNVTGKFYAEIKGKYVGHLFENKEEAVSDGKKAAEKLNVASGVFFSKGSPDADQVQGELAQKSSKGESMFQKLKNRLGGGTPVADPDEHSAHRKQPMDLADDVKEVEKLAKDEPERLSYDEMKSAMELYGKCRKHLMEKEKLSEEDADKHLGEMDDESVKKMAAEHDEDEKKMAKDEPERLSRLQKASTIRTKLASAQKGVQLAQKKAKLAIKLSSLKSLGKVTPAELKKLDISKLAGASDEAIALALSTYDSREPVIDPRIYGSSKGVESAELIKLAKQKDLESETRTNFKSAGGNKAVRLGMDEDQTTEKIQKEIQEIPAEKMSSGSHEDLKMCLSHLEAGRHEEAKEVLKSCLSKMEMPGADEEMAMDEKETEKHLSALAEASLTLETTLQETDKLMKELIG